jgi:hypothetical protein
MKHRALDLWLTLYGVFLALLVTTLYEVVPENWMVGDLPARFAVGALISAIGLVFLVYYAIHHPDEEKKDVPSVLWLISLNNNNNEIKALGTDEAELTRILVTWKENVEKK